MLLWTDLETTGLSLANDQIIEIAMTFTDDNLKVVGEPFNMVIKQNVSLTNLDPKVVSMHSSNGLWAEVTASKNYMEDAHQGIKRFFEKTVPAAQLKETMMAGSSVHFDRSWLMRDMPDIVKALHYRIVDVSTLKTLTYRWAPDKLAKMPFAGESNHRASRDVETAIEQARFFREVLFS